ncbi:hypothetical protein [Thermithiobacillus plumbiphilus]|uniref:Uncharacterized protein n=1 Tax=Thermithiobacillus plumbiphilus TaxID=1729899 RepID=A0ABU9D9E9_9PROT
MPNYKPCNIGRRRFLGQVIAGAAIVGFGGCDSRTPDAATTASGSRSGTPPNSNVSGSGTSSEAVLPLPKTVLYAVNDRIIEQWPPVFAASMMDHLGFNLGYPKDLGWVLDRARAAGCREIRSQPGAWSNEEIVAAPGKYRGSSVKLLNELRSRGMRVRLVGAYGPPWQANAQLKLLSQANTGDSTLVVEGDLSGFEPWMTFLALGAGGSIHPSQGKNYLDKWNYYGTLVLAIDVSKRQITLAAPVLSPLPAGTPLALNKLMYPFPQQVDPMDPGVVAYCNYLRELARQVESNGVTGSIEIWNEPPWPDDAWLSPKRFFSGTPPDWMTSTTDDFAVYPAVLANLSARWPYQNVKLCNAATNKTADGDWLFLKTGDWESLENPSADLLKGSEAETFTEAFHPYGPFPESQTWYPTAAETFPYKVVQGGNQSANLPLAVAAEERFLKTFGYSIPLEVTETGLNTGNDFVQALFLVRQFLAYQSLQLKNIDFYVLEEESNYSVLNSATYKERMALAVLGKLIHSLGSLETGTQRIMPAAMPEVTSYDGQWPLAMVPIVGTGQLLLALWQRNYPESGKSWSDESGQRGYVQASAAKVVLRVPDGMAYQDSHDLFSQEPLKISILSGGSMSISGLRDHPVFLRFIIPPAPGG